MKFQFIGANKDLKPNSGSTSLLLRRSFNVTKKGNKYLLKVIGLGTAIYYLNEKRITDSVLLTPVSDYQKTLYFDTFDVTNLIEEGINILAIELGNGFYNESLNTVWNFNKAHWRDEKCLGLILERDGETILESDESFKTLYSPFVIYNELRGGETVDFRKLINFESKVFNDSNWLKASYIKNQKTARIFENKLTPIKEFGTYPPVRKIISKNGVIFDFGVNISGYVECIFNEKAGNVITFKHAEDINKNELELHGLDCYQKGEPFQLDQIISGGVKGVFKPKFTYHGFRYVEVSGVTNFDDFEIHAIKIHQDLKHIKEFPIFKDEIKTKIFNAGINSILSNSFYSFTDCPTREKLNWLNDMQASLPVIMEYFDVKDLLKKVMQDIVDTQRDDGNIAGIAPSPDWGYEYGPLCGFAIVDIPKLFLDIYKDDSLFKEYKKEIYMYYDYLINHFDFILGDWTGNTNHPDTPTEFVINSYIYLFNKTLIDVYKDTSLENDLLKRKGLLLNTPIKGQTIPSFLIVNDIGDKALNVKRLLEAIKENKNHLNAGMFGVQFIYEALQHINRKDLIDKIVLNKKAPSFRLWIEEGATSLYENFNKTHTLSMNHHMFSNVIKYL